MIVLLAFSCWLLVALVVVAVDDVFAAAVVCNAVQRHSDNEIVLRYVCLLGMNSVFSQQLVTI